MAKTAAPPLVTLTTDFGRADFHLPRLRGCLLGEFPGLRLVDITHEVPPYDIVRAAHIFGRSWSHFPKGTIHLISVNDYYQPRGRFLALRHEGHYFLAPDNGLLGLVLADINRSELFALDNYRAGDLLPTVYARAVAHLAVGKPFHEIGIPATTMTERLAFQPVIGPNYIRGTAVFIDRFDNVTTNITRELFEDVGRGRGFQLLVKRNTPIDALSFRYFDVPEGEALCRFNSDDYLEIAINLGRAASLLGIGVEDMVQVEFGGEGGIRG